MSEVFRSRDCVVLVKGDAYPVTISEDMARDGWSGGQGVQWVASAKDELLVTYSDGYYAGFLLWGSDETSDKHTSTSRNQAVYRFSTMGAGGWHIMTTSYERYTYTSRMMGGPLVPIVYTASDRLVFSLRGLFTREDEFTLSGDPRAPNSYFIAFVTQAPSAANNYYMGIQTSI
jgi:hypothetical protein